MCVDCGKGYTLLGRGWDDDVAVFCAGLLLCGLHAPRARAIRGMRRYRPRGVTATGQYGERPATATETERETERETETETETGTETETETVR